MLFFDKSFKTKEKIKISQEARSQNERNAKQAKSRRRILTRSKVWRKHKEVERLRMEKTRKKIRGECEMKMMPTGERHGKTGI